MIHGHLNYTPFSTTLTGTTPNRVNSKVEDWRRYYNEDRPHGAIGDVPPVAFMTAGSATNPLPEGARKL
jgi:putative transposase